MPRPAPVAAPTPSGDALAHVADRIRRWAVESQLPVVAGALATADARTPPRVSLAAGAAGGGGTQRGAPDDAALDALLSELGAVAAAGPALVVLDVDRLEAGDVDDALGTLRAGDAPAEAVARAEALRGAEGRVAGVYLAVLTSAPAAVLTQAWTAPWHDVVFDPESFVPEREDPVAARAAADRAAERERATWTARKQTETARRLLADPAFPVARTEKARLVLLRDLLGDEAPENDALLREIAREAQAMHELRSAR